MSKLRHLISPWVTLIFVTGCSTSTKPCSSSGDTSWNPPIPLEIKGNRQCHQAKQKDGKYLNHGKYVEWYKNGSIAIEGEFKDGKKDGVWVQYNEKGQKILEKKFRNGVEVSGP